MRKRNTDIDIGLAALVEHAERGQTLRDCEIAEVCGVNRKAINEIGNNALKKIRTHHIQKFDKSLIGYSQAKRHQLSNYSHS